MSTMRLPNIDVRAMRAALIGLLGVVTAACSGNDLTNTSTSERWSDSTFELDITADSSTWRSPCVQATLPPIGLDSAGRFSVESVTLVETGNVMHQPGDVLHVQGSVRNDTMTIGWYITHPGGPVSDPLAATLLRNGPHPSFVCVA